MPNFFINPNILLESFPWRLTIRCDIFSIALEHQVFYLILETFSKLCSWDLLDAIGDHTFREKRWNVFRPNLFWQSIIVSPLQWSRTAVRCNVVNKSNWLFSYTKLLRSRLKLKSNAPADQTWRNADHSFCLYYDFKITHCAYLSVFHTRSVIGRGRT